MDADRRGLKTMALLYENESYSIIGAAMEVHNELGCGFLEAVYQEALEREFKSRSIPYKREALTDIYYKGVKLDKQYIADFICYDKIIVELKALSKLVSDNQAQVLNYLKATGYKLGLLINFGTTKLEYKRIIRENPRVSADNEEFSPRITRMNADRRGDNV
jgi:GxxExxY protein